jgi:pyridinium-3,5-biscarboxylic acid mononucleotide synthase
LKPERIEKLLQDVAAGRCGVADALTALRNWPVEDLGFAQVDHHRHLRRGVPEVVFAIGKRPEETERIAQSVCASGSELLVTRADAETLDRLERRFPEGRANRTARTFTFTGRDAYPGEPGTGLVAVLAAGTSDIPVAEEAVETARALGARVVPIYDVGVAGIHRLVPHLETLYTANAVVAVAGMEGALPSVVAGLTRSIVLAVPTSVGYGASLGGLAALLAMLNSCSAGVTVVNIDNGFGAGYAAGLVNRCARTPRPDAGGGEA